MIWIVMALDIVALVSSYFQYSLLQGVINGGEISMEAAEANDSRERLVAIVYLIAYVISAITFIMWFRRAYFNLHQKIHTLEHSEGWAAGSWFVPILNLFRPFQIMRELFRETRFLLQAQNYGYNESPSDRNLGLWWTLWIVNNLLSQIVYRYSKNAETVEELNTLTIIAMVESLVGIFLAIITVNVIKEYSKYEGLIAEMPDTLIQSIGAVPVVESTGKDYV